VPQSTKSAVNQVIEEPFLGELQKLRADRDPRLPIVLKVANLNGWTYQALGDAIGITREGVRQKITRAGLDPHGVLPEIPLAPRRTVASPKAPKARLRVKPEVADRLYEMWLVASTVNGRTPADAPERKVSEEYTALLAALVDQGVAVKEIGRAIGINRTGINARLARHGYRPASPSQAHNTYKGQPTKSGEQTECKWGHPLSGDNLRIVSTTGMRACRACGRRRSSEYNARKRAKAGLGVPRPYRRKTT
jgi:hypothetical protein